MSTDSIRFRGTLSQDIRAPNLNDLFQPAGVSSTGFTDLLTGGNNSLRLVTRGNPDLTPEKARTLTVGMVLTPTFLPRFSLSVDYYRTKITDAITRISYQSNAIQNICLASAPKLQFAVLLAGGASDHRSDRSQLQESQRQLPDGNPQFTAQCGAAGDARLRCSRSTTTGTWRAATSSVRHLVGYQPVNTTINIPGAFPTWAVEPKLRQTTFLSYTNNAWTVALQNQWLGSVNLATSDKLSTATARTTCSRDLPLTM